MFEVLAACILGACAVALFQWRFALLACVVVALLQDPLRKLTPGAPVAFVGLVALPFAAAVLAASLNRVSLHPRAIIGWKKRLQPPALGFLVLLFLQALHTIFRWEAPFLTLIGAVFYLMPVVAVMFAHQFAIRYGTRGILQFFVFFAICTLVWMLGVLAEARGMHFSVLGEVGVGQIIYDYGLNRKAVSGFYRASEIAAWHIAMAACALFIFLNGRKLSAFKILLVCIVTTYLFYVGVLTGRRKMLVYVAVFACAYVVLYSWFLKGKARLAVFGVLAMTLILALLESVGQDPSAKSFVDQRDWTLADRDARAAWTARALTVFADIPERFMLLGYRPVEWAIQDFGWMGAGLGTVSQGAQYFGGGALRFGGAAEGGLGKITMELGAPGLVVFCFLLYCVVREIWLRLYALSRGSRSHATLAFGLLSMLAANVAAFSVATQVFGDVFVLLVVGTVLGFLLALPTVAYRESVVAQVATSPVDAVHRWRIAPQGSVPITRAQSESRF